MPSDSATVALGQSTEDIAREWLFSISGMPLDLKYELVKSLAALLARETAKARVEELEHQLDSSYGPDTTVSEWRAYIMGCIAALQAKDGDKS